MHDRLFQDIFDAALVAPSRKRFTTKRLRTLLANLRQVETAVRKSASVVIGGAFEGVTADARDALVELAYGLEVRSELLERLGPSVESLAETPGRAASDDHLTQLDGACDRFEATAERRGRKGPRVEMVWPLLVRLRRLRYAAWCSRAHLVARGRGEDFELGPGELLELIESALHPALDGPDRAAVRLSLTGLTKPREPRARAAGRPRDRKEGDAFAES